MNLSKESARPTEITRAIAPRELVTCIIYGNLQTKEEEEIYPTERSTRPSICIKERDIITLILRGQVMTAINITSLTICRDYEAQTLDEMKCQNKLESYHTWPLLGRLRQTPLHLWKKVKDLNAVYENTWFHSIQRNKAAKS